MHPARQHTACTPCQAPLLLIWPGLARREEEKKKRTEVEAICGKYQVERDAAHEAKEAALKEAERSKLGAQRAHATADEEAAARLRAEKAARAARAAHKEELQRQAAKHKKAILTLKATHKLETTAAVAAARDEVLVQAAAEEKEEIQKARRGKAEAEAGRRAAEKRAEAAEANAERAAAAAEREAAEAARAKAELMSFTADIGVQLPEAVEQHGQAAAAQQAEHNKALSDMKADCKKALSKVLHELAEAKTAATSARAQWQSAAIQLGKAQKTATEKSARVELQEDELARLRPVVKQLSVAHGHIAARDARISQLVAREQLPANSSRVPTRSDACSVCNRPAGLVVLPHEPGTPWPLWQCAIARRVMIEGHITPSNLARVLSGALVFFTGQLPTSEYVCDDKFGARCVAPTLALTLTLARHVLRQLVITPPRESFIAPA